MVKTYRGASSRERNTPVVRTYERGTPVVRTYERGTPVVETHRGSVQGVRGDHLGQVEVGEARGEAGARVLLFERT